MGMGHVPTILGEKLSVLYDVQVYNYNVTSDDHISLVTSSERRDNFGLTSFSGFDIRL